MEFNRLSPQYFQMSSLLEKMIGLLGSMCITKTVIETREGEPFPMLDTLTIEDLRKKTAFHFRKSYESFMETAAFLQCSRKALDLSIRWAVLDRRLQATAEKIEAIKAGKVKADLSDKSEPAKDQADLIEEQEPREETAAPLSPCGHALPIDKAAVRAAGTISADPAGTAPVPEGPEVMAETGDQADIQPESCDEIPEEEEEEEEEENVPYVSDELIRRMSEYFSRREALEREQQQYDAAVSHGTGPPG